VEGFESAGYGRVIHFHEPQKLGTLLSRITAGLGSLSGLSVAVPQSTPAGQKSNLSISSIGICAGSGGSMLNNLPVDLLFTGELSHHEALAAIEQGKVVITAFHSNTERQFLKERMQNDLTAGIKEEIGRLVKVDGENGSLVQGKFDVVVSKADRDPFEIVVAGQTGW
jgi:putative NIF3 family GTP cyclohydrolase 1 type 2